MTKLFQVELLNDEAIRHLEALVQLQLIRLEPSPPKRRAFPLIVSRLRKRAERLPLLSLDEITQEVESVRTHQQKPHAAH